MGKEFLAISITDPTPKYVVYDYCCFGAEVIDKWDISKRWIRMSTDIEAIENLEVGETHTIMDMECPEYMITRVE